MKSWRKVLVRTLLVALLGFVWAGYKIVFGHPFTINQLANRQALLYLVRSPELLTGLGIVEGTWLDRHSGKLAEVGPAAREADYAFLEKSLAEVQRFDRAKLTPQDQITYDILVDQWSNGLATRRFAWLSSEGLYPIAPMWGTPEIGAPADPKTPGPLIALPISGSATANTKMQGRMDPAGETISRRASGSGKS